jgi:membrane protease YdiL (CAAX protease family)
MGAALVAIVWVVAASAVSASLRLPIDVDGSSAALAGWAVLLWPNAVLAALAAWWLARRGQLRDLMRFRPGDPSLGIGLCLLLLLMAWLSTLVLLPPDSVSHAWLLRVFLLAGDTSGAASIGCLMGLAVCEELVWRGFVQAELAARFGPRRGWIIAAALYATAYCPTLFTLRDAAAGPNPLLVLLALGSGLSWGFSTARSGRLMPAIISHAAFAYLATQYLGRLV